MKSIRELITGAKELDYVGEIIAGEVTAVAGVDRPATGRRWRFFKGAPGSKAGISPTLAPGVNYTECLAGGDMPTPTLCEAAGQPDALGNFTDVLRADMAGHDASVADLKMLREVEAAIDDGTLGFKATFEECVDSVMSRPGFEPQEGRTPEESARAICATKPGGPQEGKEEGKMITRGRKCPDGIVPEGKDVVAPPVPEEMAADVPLEDEAAAIEVPSTPTEWSLADCLTQATDMGLPEDAAVSACQMVRGEFGDPNDETKILVPDGTKPEGLINAAAMSLGLGKSLKVEPTGPPAVKFQGENRWRTLFKRFLGIREPRPGRKLVEYLRGVESRVEGLMSEHAKAKDDLRLVIEQQGQMIHALANLAGFTLPATAPAAPAAAAEPAPPQGSGNPIMEPAKSAPTAPADGAKDGAAAGAPIVAAPSSDDRIARLEATVQELVAALTGGAGPAMEEPGDNELPDLVGAGVAAPSAEPKRVSAATPPPNRLLQAKWVNPEPVGSTAGGTEYSTILGAPVTASERNAARNGGGLPRIARR